EGWFGRGVAGGGVADSGARARRFLDGAAEAGVGAELLAGVEARDGVDLQGDGQGDDRPDTRRGLQHGQLGGVVLPRGRFDLGFPGGGGGVGRGGRGQGRLGAAGGGGDGGGLGGWRGRRR